MTPRVSVIVPTRNRIQSLQRALAGVDAQHFRDLEIIVVDDASTDGTAAWLRASRPDVRLVELESPCGAAAARNRGIECSRGAILAFLDDDDVWSPAYLDTQCAQLDAHPEAELATTAHIEVDARGATRMPDLRPLHHYPDALVHMLAECPIHTLSVVVCRRAAFDRIGLFEENLTIVHDLDWYLRLAAAGGRTQHAAAALVEHAVPGGLVTQHREWFLEEREVHRRVFAVTPSARPYEAWIRALRALFFARLAFLKGDLSSGTARLAEAAWVSPLDTLHIAAVRLRRRKSHQAGGEAR